MADKGQQKLTLGKKIFYSMIPLLVFLLLLVGIEILFHIFDYPQATFDDLFDPGTILKPASDTGFALVTDMRIGIIKGVEQAPADAFAIGCFGDSTTFGSGGKKIFSYPNQLQQLFDYHMPEVLSTSLGGPQTG